MNRDMRKRNPLYKTMLSMTTAMPLDEVIQRLQRNNIVDGIIIVGSMAKKTFTPVSDYDIIVILSKPSIKPYIVCTRIDQRIADVVFSTTKNIRQISKRAKLSLPANTMDANLVRWLKIGDIVFDRTGLLRETQHKWKNKKFTETRENNELYSAWHNINYNLKQNKRMAGSKDSIYLTALDIRLLYSGFQLFTAYFLFRDLPWRGEKESIRYLQNHDSAYLTLLKQYLAEKDRNKKIRFYERLARKTLAPVSTLWSDDDTAIMFAPEVKVNAAVVKKGLTFWNDLIRGKK